MPPNPVTAQVLRIGYLRHDLVASVRTGNPRRFVRAIASFAMPSRWPAPRATREAVQDAAIARGQRLAAVAAEAELAGVPAAGRPRTAPALRRATALDLIATGLPSEDARIERTVAAFLRGELAPPSSGDARDPAASAAEAAAGAASARRDGHSTPIVVATYPGFHPNPYGELMETAYRDRGLVPVHVADPAAIDAIVAGAEAGGYRVVAHLNAPDRFVGPVPTEADATEPAAIALGRIDHWIEQGVTLICSVHNGPRLSGPRGTAERIVAQGIVDRAALVHVLTASTPARLASWITIDPDRVLHVPHPSYDGVLGPIPSREVARPDARGRDSGPKSLVLGLVGSLVPRKGCLALVEAFERLPEHLGNRRPPRLVLAGSPGGADAERLIRRALRAPGIVARFGYIPEAELPGLLATIDVAVVPYADLLNSGWLHLALSAGIPAIAPAGSTAEEIVEPEALLTYEPDDPTALGRALGSAGRLGSGEAREAARRSVAQLGADRLSARLVDAIVTAASQQRAVSGATR